MAHESSENEEFTSLEKKDAKNVPDGLFIVLN